MSERKDDTDAAEPFFLIIKNIYSFVPYFINFRLRGSLRIRIESGNFDFFFALKLIFYE